MVTGLVCGAAGGVVMVLASAAVAQRYHANADVQGAIGRALGSLGGRDPNLAALVLAAAVGALLGAVFGRMTRRLFKIPARMFFGAVLAPVLWLLIHAFVLLRFAPRMAEALPVGSMCIGALVYGLCVSVIPPFDRRRRKA